MSTSIGFLNVSPNTSRRPPYQFQNQRLKLLQQRGVPHFNSDNSLAWPHNSSPLTHTHSFNPIARSFHGRVLNDEIPQYPAPPLPPTTTNRQRDFDQVSMSSETYSQRSDTSHSEIHFQDENTPLSLSQTQSHPISPPSPRGHLQPQKPERMEMAAENSKTKSSPGNGHLLTILKLFIFFMSFASIGICAYILVCDEMCPWETRTHKNEKIRISCNDLKTYMRSEQTTSNGVMDERIEEYRVRSSTDCEVPFKVFAEKMTQNEMDDAQIIVYAATKGPVFEYSTYNLSMKHPSATKNLNIDKNTLVIREEGHYFIYFTIQLSYGQDTDRPPCKELRFKTSVCHLIRHRMDSSTRQNTALLSSEHSCCETCAVESTSEFTGGLFHLAKGDKLFLQVSAPNHVGKKDDNFMGIFKLSKELEILENDA